MQKNNLHVTHTDGHKRISVLRPISNGVNKFILAFFLCIFAFILFSQPVFASTDSAALVTCGLKGMKPCEACEVFLLIQNVLNFIWYSVTLWVAILMFLYGGILMMVSAFSGGETRLHERGKKIITNTVIGILIVFVAWLGIDYTIKILSGKMASGSTNVKFGPWNELKCSLDLGGGAPVGGDECQSPFIPCNGLCTLPEECGEIIPPTEEEVEDALEQIATDSNDGMVVLDDTDISQATADVQTQQVSPKIFIEGGAFSPQDIARINSAYGAALAILDLDYASNHNTYYVYSSGTYASEAAPFTKEAAGYANAFTSNIVSNGSAILSGSDAQMEYHFTHELAHAQTFKKFGLFGLGSSQWNSLYAQSVQAGKGFVSSYASTNLWEDAAETAVSYYKSGGNAANVTSDLAAQAIIQMKFDFLKSSGVVR